MDKDSMVFIADLAEWFSFHLHLRGLVDTITMIFVSFRLEGSFFFNYKNIFMVT